MIESTQKKLRECERRLIELRSCKESQNPAQERRLIENYARDAKELQNRLIVAKNQQDYDENEEYYEQNLIIT